MGADATCTDDATICTDTQTCTDGVCVDNGDDSGGANVGLIIAFIFIIVGIALICVGLLGGKC